VRFRAKRHGFCNLQQYGSALAFPGRGFLVLLSQMLLGRDREDRVAQQHAATASPIRCNSLQNRVLPAFLEILTRRFGAIRWLLHLVRAHVTPSP